MPRSWIIATLAVAGVGLAASMVVLGWSEATPTQVALLELASLPLQLAFGMGLWHLHGRGTPPDARDRRRQAALAALGCLGLLLVAAAYLGGPRGLVHFGQSVVWLALLAALVLIVRRLPRPRFTHSTFIADQEADAPAGPGDEPLFDGE
ncbi:MAG: hypothetical protein WBC14_03525 [Propionicimonas sp.]